MKTLCTSRPEALSENPHIVPMLVRTYLREYFVSLRLHYRPKQKLLPLRARPFTTLPPGTKVRPGPRSSQDPHLFLYLHRAHLPTMPAPAVYVVAVVAVVGTVAAAVAFKEVGKISIIHQILILTLSP